MTRTIALLAVICLLVAGVAATRILSSDSIPPAGAAASVPDLKTAVIANREAKQDRLPISAAARAVDLLQAANLNEPLRQAYASFNDIDLEAARPVTPVPDVPAVPPPAVSAAPPPQPPSHTRPGRPQPQKPYALLSDAQIASIKGRLKLSPSQESYWPDVEQALHALARKIQTARQVNPNANAGSLDPDSAEVQRLKSAAMPLLMQLREDQKDEVRRLARVIGLEKVAAAI